MTKKKRGWKQAALVLALALVTVSQMGAILDVPFAATLLIEAVTGTTPYVLVDLSDSSTVDWPHSATNNIILRGIEYDGFVTAANGIWICQVGVVVEGSTTDGTAELIYAFGSAVATSGNMDIGGFIPVPRGGLDLTVDTDNDTLERVLTNGESADSVHWQNDTKRTSPAGSSATYPADGDMVMLCTEAAGAAALTVNVTVYYDTE